MNSIKTLIVATVLASVAYGVYVSLNKPPRERDEVASASDAAPPPVIELPEQSGPAVIGEAGTVEVPAEAAAPDAGEAPAYQPTDGVAATAASPISYDSNPAAMSDAGAAPGYDPQAAVPAQQPPSADAQALDGVPQTIEQANEVIQSLLDANRLAEAQLELSRWYNEPGFSEMHQELLDQLTGTVVYSAEHYLEPAYTVQPGDSLERIAQRYSVPWQLLAHVNGLGDPRQLQPGSTLKVLNGPFDAYVEVSKMQLSLWLNGRYAGRFAIGIGRDQTTPVDQELRVQEKLENPVYYGPDQTIAADDPQNPLGERWLGLGNHLGIHGTTDLASIGREESRGCIRLAPQDVAQLYDILSVGSRVKIVR